MSAYNDAIELDRIKKLQLSEVQFLELVSLVLEYGYMELMQLDKESILQMLYRVS